MSFGKRLRQRRDEMGYTREDVASRLGVSFSAVQKWENDERRPTLSMSGKIAELFGTTVSELVGDSFDKPSLEDDWPEVAQVLRRAGKLPTIEERKRIARIVRAAMESEE